MNFRSRKGKLNMYGYTSIIKYPDLQGRMSGFLKMLFQAKGWIEPAPGNAKVWYLTEAGKRHISLLTGQ